MAGKTCNRLRVGGLGSPAELALRRKSNGSPRCEEVQRASRLVLTATQQWKLVIDSINGNVD